VDPDPAIFVIDLQDDSKNYFLNFSAYFFLNVLHHLSKINVKKRHKIEGI